MQHNYYDCKFKKNDLIDTILTELIDTYREYNNKKETLDYLSRQQGTPKELRKAVAAQKDREYLKEKLKFLSSLMLL